MFSAVKMAKELACVFIAPNIITSTGLEAVVFWPVPSAKVPTTHVVWVADGV